MSFNSKYTGAQVEVWLDNIKSYSANDILAKLKTVDGENSGLDADTLDGYHAIDFTKTIISSVDNFLNFTNKARFQTAWVSGQGDFCSLVIPTWSANNSDNWYLSELRFDNALSPKYRTSHNGTVTSDWRYFAFTDSNVASATKASQDEEGSNIVATYVKKTVLESFQYFQYRGACNNINAQTLPGMYDYADTSNAIAGTNYGILLCFYNRDFPTTWAWGVQVFFGDNNKFAYRTSIRKSGVWNNWVIVA